MNDIPNQYQAIDTELEELKAEKTDIQSEPAISQIGNKKMTASSDAHNDHNPDLIKVYDQLCQSYRAIDDFRAKLLGFLPLTSAGGAFLLLNDVLVNPEKSRFAKPFLEPLGLFGFVVTLGLYFYEIYGIRKCHALIKAGKQLETSLDIADGQFTKRPRNVLYLINEPFATGVIYPAVLAGWMFLILAFPQSQPDQSPAIEAALSGATWVFVVGFLITLIYNLVLPYHETISRSLIRRKVP
jgi:hypothetical protein